MDGNQKVMTMDEFTKFFSDLLDQKIREMGLDKIDRKHGIFPSEGDPNGEGLDDLSKEERVAKFVRAIVDNDYVTAKALSEGVSADGGFLVPTEFRAAIVAKRDIAAVIRPRATVFPMSRDKMDVPLEGNAMTLFWSAENTPLTESNPNFGSVTLNTNKLTGLSKMSRELFSDTAVNLMDFLAGLYGRKFALEEDKKFMTGSGTGEPKGLRQYTISSTAQAAANLVADDIIKLFYNLGSQYRSLATWIMHNSIIRLVRTLKDANGRYLWADGFTDAPATILGRPVAEQNDIPTNLGVGSDESEIWFGDLNYYLIGDREEMTIESTTEGAGTFENHQVAVKVIERIDGQLGITDPFVKLTAVK
ncbi:MAG: phage major capsid protein [Candidatus Levybacteria bacterium]|nr:phage major capsid protein [Candidatus Levybacteria bacterium]